MSRKIRKVVASTLALAMMAGSLASMPAGQFVLVNAADQAVSSSNSAGGIKGPKVDAGTYSVKAGETFKVKIKVTDNADGFNALNAWLDIDTDVFEIVADPEAGDLDDPNLEDSDAYSCVTTNVFQKKGAAANIKTVLNLYSDTNNHKGDECLSTFTLKVKDGVKDGYYSLPFDANGDGGAMANRIDSSRNPIVLNPTYYGALVTVGSPSADTPSQTPTSQTQPTQAPSTGSLSAKVADASGSAGSTVKTTLTVSGTDIAGFTAELGFDASALELTSASASGWDVNINGKKLVAVANPYQDNSSATVNLEFKAASSASGSYAVSVDSITGASKDKEKEYNGTGTKGTISISGGSSSTPTQTPTTKPTSDTGSTTPNSDAIQIIIGDVEGNAGETVTVPIYAKNVGAGFSTVQFDYAMEDSFKITKVVKGDEKCQWTVGQELKSLQFLQGDGNNVTTDCVIGKIKVEIPAGTADGTYKISISGFEGSTYSTTEKKQLQLTGSAFAGTAGSIKIGAGGSTVDPTVAPTDKPTDKPTNVPTVLPTNSASSSAEQEVASANTAGGVKGPKVDAGKYEVKAGEEFKVKIKVTDNADGFNALNAWLDVNTDVFEIVADPEAGDLDDPNLEDSDAYSCVTTNVFQKKNAASNIKTILNLYSDTNNHKGDEVLSTFTLKVKDGVADGYYSLPFDATGDGGAMANRINSDRDPIVINPTYYGGLVKVGDGGSSSTPTATPTSTVKPTATPTVKPTSETPNSDAIQIVIGDVEGAAGETVTVPVYAKNVGAGFSTVQFDYDMDETFTVSKVVKGDEKCQWTVGQEHKTLQFLQGDGNNVTTDCVIGKIKVEVPAGTADGTYKISISGFEGSTYSSTEKKQLKLDGSAFVGTAGSIKIGDGGATVDPTPTATPSPTTVPTPTVVPTSGNTGEQEISTPGVKGEAGPKVDAGKYKVKAGEEFTVKIKVTDNADGFNALNAWLDVDTDIFEIVKEPEAGDLDDPDLEDTDEYSNVSTNIFQKKNAAANIKTILNLYSDTNNHKGDAVLSTFTLKVKDGVKAGFYSLPFDANGDGGAMANRINSDRDPIVINPTYYGGLVEVEGEGGSTPTATPTPTATVKPTTPPTEASKDPNSEAIQIVIGDVEGKAGETVTVPVYAKNVGDGFSTVQFDYEMDDSFTVSKVVKGDEKCQWTVGQEHKTLQFLQGDGNNVTTDCVIGKIKIEIPADTKDGKYTIKLSGFEGSSYSKELGKQVKLDGSAFEGVTGTITIGDGGTVTEPDYDVNGDGVVNTADVVALKKFLLMVDGAKVVNGDVNADGKINSQDMVRLIQHLLSK